MLQRSMGKIRIIGGKWKKSLINFEDADGLRPTGNRQREMLFNWLPSRIGDFSGKRTLDLFAGTGALSFEAASRGFSECVLFEKNRKTAAGIKKNIDRLNASELKLHIGDGLLKSDQIPGLFDLIFLDPPFSAGLYEKAIEIAKKKLKPEGFIYVESPKPISEEYLRSIGLETVRSEKGPTINMQLIAFGKGEEDASALSRDI